MQILYFAWLRDRAGTAEEQVTPPPEVATVADLIGWLRGRDARSAAAFAQPAALRCAVNQSFAALDARIGPDDEIAFFPPVTGG